MNDGWGLATDGKVIFGSDGSSTLYQLNPQTFKGLFIQMKFHFLFLSLFMYAYSFLFVFHGICIALFVAAESKHVIYYKGHQVYNLNELEYINGEVWANVLPVCLCLFDYNFKIIFYLVLFVIFYQLKK